jgi:hypothetical protein
VESADRDVIVLHVILAISALHLYSTHPNEPKLYDQAISHHNAAIRLARPHIAAVCPENSEAVFNFSAFNSLYSFAEPPLRPRVKEIDGHDYLNDLFGTFRMCRGVSAVMREVISVLKMEGPADNAGSPSAYDEESVLPTLAATYPQLRDLERLIVEESDPGYQASALDATKRLFVGMRVLDQTPIDHSSVSLITRWPIHISDSFLELCLARHPVALIVVAYFAVLINKRTNMWFNERWPWLIINSVDGVLKGSQWEQWIEWPRRSIISRLHS